MVVQQGFQEVAKSVKRVDNLFLFPTVKKCSKSVNNWRSYCRTFGTTFLFETQCISLSLHLTILYLMYH